MVSLGSAPEPDDPVVPLTPDETRAPFAGMVHVVTSEQNFRRLMLEQEQARNAQLGPAGLSFLEQGSADEQTLSRRGNPLATRFMTKPFEPADILAEGRSLLPALASATA